MEGSSDATHSGRLSELARIARPLARHVVGLRPTREMVDAELAIGEAISRPSQERAQGEKAMAKITRTNPEGISKPFSNYSHVVTAEGAQKLVFCAGQVGADVDGKVLPPDDFDAQAKMVMANLTKALAAGGAKIADVTKITIYICNPHDVPKARGILQTYFVGQPPASTLCILRGLANPNFLLEIEAIAAV
jgi:2-iminobutanoate/2-iminopropanoate deaminase